jgi:hypothetical protein
LTPTGYSSRGGFKLDGILDAYETFGNAAKTKALKVIIEV